MVSEHKNYSLIIIVLLLSLFVLCLVKLKFQSQLYYVDFVLNDLNAEDAFKPDFLKKMEASENLSECEIYQPIEIILPRYKSDEESTITDCWADFSKVIVIDANKIASNQLLLTVETTIDSIKQNNLNYVNIEIKYDGNKLYYQSFIDILDLLEKKNSMLYGVHKDVIYWINRN